MRLTEFIENLISELFDFGSTQTDVYEETNEIRGEMTVDDVLEKILPITTEENLHLNKKGTSIKYCRPALRKNAKTNHRTWLVTFVYEQLNGRLIDDGEQTECFWVIVDDETGTVGEKIYPR